MALMEVDPAMAADLWARLVSWDNWWLDFGAAPFTARTLPG